MTYQIYRHGAQWRLSRVGDDGITMLGLYGTRRAAVTAGRLLAGRAGRVVTIQ